MQAKCDICGGVKGVSPIYILSEGNVPMCENCRDKLEGYMLDGKYEVVV